MELSCFIVYLQRPSCIGDLWLLGHTSTEQQDAFDLCYQTRKDSFPLDSLFYDFLLHIFPFFCHCLQNYSCIWADKLSTPLMPENDELKKGQPDQSKNALDKRSAPSPRGIATRGNLSVLSIYLWLINHLKIWYLEIIFFLWFIILSTLLFLVVYFVKIRKVTAVLAVVSGLKLTFSFLLIWVA